MSRAFTDPQAQTLRPYAEQAEPTRHRRLVDHGERNLAALMGAMLGCPSVRAMLRLRRGPCGERSARSLIDRLLLVVAVWLACTTGTLAEPHQQGIAAFMEGKFSLAVAELTPLAEQGDVDAAYILGYMYLEGHGVVASFDESGKFYELVPDQGIYYNKGLGYLYGLGVPQDYMQAHMWFNLGAGTNNAACSRNRALVERLMSAPQIGEAQERAAEWIATYGPPR